MNKHSALYYLAGASKEIAESISRFATEDVSGNEYFMAIKIQIQRALDMLDKSLSCLNPTIEISERVAEFGSNFHTMLRKMYDDESSVTLYNAISKNSNEWNRILKQFEKSCDKFNNWSNPISCLSMTSKFYKEDDYNLKHAFIFFFLQNKVEDVEFLFKQFAGND